jgi:oligo-1,6-glucosidase
VVALGDFVLLEPEHPTLYAFTRSLGSETLLVLGNFSNDRMDAALPGIPAAANSPVILGNYASVSPAGTTLRPWEAKVIRLV